MLVVNGRRRSAWRAARRPWPPPMPPWRQRERDKSAPRPPTMERLPVRQPHRERTANGPRWARGQRRCRQGARHSGARSGSTSPSRGHRPSDWRAAAAAHPPRSVQPAPWHDMDGLLKVLVEKKASDLHLRCGEPPLMRIDGEIVRLEGYRTIENDAMTAMLRAIMPARSRQEYRRHLGHRLRVRARGRCALPCQRAQGSARRRPRVFRVIPSNVDHGRAARPVARGAATSAT